MQSSLKHSMLKLTSALLAGALAMAACGGDDDDDANASSDGAEATGGADADAALEPVTLGFITPQSGQFASIGSSFEHALELFMSEHDDQLGGHPVEMVTVDEGAGAAEAVPGARKLIQQDDVDVVVGVVSSATAAAVFPLFDQAKIPVVFSQGYPYPEVTTDPSPYLWEPGSANAPFTVSMGTYMADNVSADGGSVYFIAADYVQGKTVLNATRKSFEEAGGTVAGTDFAPLGETLDYQPFLSKIQQSEADAVWAFFAGSDAVRFTEQYDGFGLADELPLYSTSSLISGANLEALGQSAVGVITNSHYSPVLETPENEAFVQSFTEEYGNAPDNFAMQQYDALTILDRALAEVDGEVSSDAIVAGLESVANKELTTPRGTWRLDPESHVPLHSIYLFEVEDQDGDIVNTFVEDLGVFHPVTGEKVEIDG